MRLSILSVAWTLWSVHAAITVTDRETISEAAAHARDLLQYRSDGMGTLISVFPGDYSDAGLADQAIGLMEYFAPSDDGHLYILAMPISKTVHNAVSSPHHNATFSVMDQAAERRIGRIGATDRNRMALFGHLERLHSDEEIKTAETTFAHYHKDARAYFPPNGPHYGFWAVFKVDRVYWLGGFGDRHYIGWLPMDLYRSSRPQRGRKQIKLLKQSPEPEIQYMNMP